MSRAWVLLVLFLLGCGGGGTSPSAVAPGGDDLVRRVATHKFWKVAVTEADVERWVKSIQGLKQPEVFIVAEQAKPTTHERDGWFQGMEENFAQGRVVFIKMNRYASSPDRATVLRDLLAELDAADFRVGDGWLNPDKKRPDPGAEAIPGGKPFRDPVKKKAD